MITKYEVLRDRDKIYAKEYTKDIDTNIDYLLVVMNKVRVAYAKPMKPSSGWRPSSINSATKNAAKASTHMLGKAVDIEDPDGSLRKWVLANLDLMQQLGLYLEDFRWTATWVHFQTVAPASGKRIYIPYADQVKYPMTTPKAWDGKYDAKYDKAA